MVLNLHLLKTTHKNTNLWCTYSQDERLTTKTAVLIGNLVGRVLTSGASPSVVHAYRIKYKTCTQRKQSLCIL